MPKTKYYYMRSGYWVDCDEKTCHQMHKNGYQVRKTVFKLHFLNENGMVACNPRDREAAHRAEMEGIATDKIRDVTCNKCRDIIWASKKK